MVLRGFGLEIFGLGFREYVFYGDLGIWFYGLIFGIWV